MTLPPSGSDMSKSQEASESNHSGHAPHPTTRGPDAVHLTRFLIFFFMQAALAALSWYCYVRPRLLPWLDLTIEDTTIRSGFTSLFSLWQSFAIGLALQICSAVFSKEKDGRGDLEKSNLLSVITGPIAEFFRSGKTFKVAILAYPVLIILRIVGNSAITVSDGVGSARSLQIGLISTFGLTTSSTNVTSQAFLERRLQTDMIVRLEQLYKSPWNFVSLPNFLIPLPTEDLSSTPKVYYDSDIVSFRYDCQWKAPDSFSGSTITIGNRPWTASIGTNASVASASRIVEYGSSIIFLLPQDQNFTGDSVYLFLGANATVSPAFNSTSNNSWIDLSDLPTIFNRDGFTSRFSSLESLQAPLATLLVCSPNLGYLSRRILLQPTANHTEPDLSILSNPEVSSPGNIHPQAARTLFTVALNTSIMSEDPVNLTRGSMNTNWISSTMFLSEIQDVDRPSYPPLDLQTINNNVDKYTLSALKAFTSGYQGPVSSIRSQQGAFAQSVNGEFTSRRLALWTSLPFAILHTVLFGILCIVLGVLVYLNKIPLPRPDIRK